MSVVTKAQLGTFCWVDLMTTDQKKAQSFYSDLFGWSGHDVPVPNGSYTIQIHQNHRVAGIGSLPPESDHSAWTCYITVEDIHASLAAIRANGGQVVSEPHLVPEEGTMAHCIDPTGAPFALWQPAKQGSDQVRGFGTMCWHELLTTDFTKAKAFYESAFDWNSELKDMGQPYNLFHSSGGTGVGGMMAITSSMGAVPSSWLVYFDIENIESTVKVATERGGKVLMGPMEIPEMGHCSVLCDPQGAAFGVWQSTAVCGS